MCYKGKVKKAGNTARGQAPKYDPETGKPIERINSQLYQPTRSGPTGNNRTAKHIKQLPIRATANLRSKSQPTLNPNSVHGLSMCSKVGTIVFQQLPRPGQLKCMPMSALAMAFAWLEFKQNMALTMLDRVL